MMSSPISADGAAWLDARPLSSLQIRVLLLCCLVGILDGSDTQALAIGVPSIAAALHVEVSMMGWAVSGSLAGAAIGALAMGGLGDRFGRKVTLTASVLIFGLFTVLTPLAATLPELVAFRVLAGLGLGGATPCFIALAAEYTPARMRGAVVSLVWASFPLGILIGGLLNGLIVLHLPWQSIFYIGGAIPLVVGILLIAALPESLSFLAARESRHPAMRRVIARIAPGETVDIAPPPRRETGIGIARLLAEGRLGITLCLWVILFACFGTTASMSWVPTILRQNGVSLAAAAVASSALGFGALFGMAVAGRLIDRFGAARALALPIVAGAIATAAVGQWATSAIVSSVFVALVGCLVGLGASGGIALTALLYPAAIRSSGAGWVLAMGRLGQVVVPGGFAVMLGHGLDVSTIFLVLSVMPLIAAAAALLLGRATAARDTRLATPIGDLA